MQQSAPIFIFLPNKTNRMTHALSIVWNPQKGIDLGFFTLHFYSLLWVAAFALGWFVMKKIYIREGESMEKLDKLFITTLIATMIGARLGHVIFYQSELFSQDPLSVFLPFSFNPEFRFTGFRGLASHGAAIGIIIAMIYYSRKVIHRPLLWVLDRVVIPVTSGGILIRVANFINAEILGDTTTKDFPLAVKFLRDEDQYRELYSNGQINSPDVTKLTGIADENLAYKAIEQDSKFADVLSALPYRHPAQLYEAFCYIFVFAIIYYMYWKTDARKKHGFIFGVFQVLLWAVRFGVEFVKQSQGGIEGENPLLSTGQWLSIPFILAGFYFIVTAKNRQETL